MQTLSNREMTALAGGYGSINVNPVINVNPTIQTNTGTALAFGLLGGDAGAGVGQLNGLLNGPLQGSAPPPAPTNGAPGGGTPSWAGKKLASRRKKAR
ncbi:MAG: hypothetical protein QM522_04745 [Chitinophagaceae bacterium]|jgi:hypothetical protein|nr:hypothetical protein [Chitinophagaceae bacterium]